jgi:fructokinase
MTESPLMVGLGEVLWDLLPSGRVLGGAPANFAYMASALGDRGVVASRVGADPLGQEACQQMERLRLTTDYLQQDAQRRTGTAGVLIDAAGQPTFTIAENVAWDTLQWTREWEQLSALADVICFGTLAQRSLASSATIESFLSKSKAEAIRIFDVNLRQSYYSEDILRRSLHHSNVVKLTDQELIRVTSMLGIEGSGQEQLARRLLIQCKLKMVCVTRGAQGSVLFSEHETVEHRGFTVKVVDTVGAGDAFTACLAHYFVRGRSLREISEYANRFASWVATQAGATPIFERQNVLEGA